ncbi:MAG: hypothetical protein IPH68_09030 [Chitinophagaceae bacterium]|nr:hypothetical protein [Chitinophagaceae bacterium]MBK8494530.1 hypothetical protein [Chitinophagaceae bacterium]
MKQKLFLLMCVAFLSTGSFAQVTVDVLINGSKAGQINLEANINTGGITYDKNTYNIIDRLSIEIHGKSVDGGYSRKVQVMGDDIIPMFTATETQGAAGRFDITDKKIINRLKQGKPVTFFVEKTPVSSAGTELISRVYLGTLTREK